MTSSITLRDVIESAPHVDPAVAESWLSGVIDICVDDVHKISNPTTKSEFQAEVDKRVRFHVRRLSGIGGSDMSAIYTEFKGGFYQFGSTSSVVREKLCLDLPDPYQGKTALGIVLEPFARKSFMNKMRDHGLKVHTEGWEKLKDWIRQGGDEQHPWLKLSPDEIFIDKNGKIWLVDFKVSSNHDIAVQYSQEVPVYYQAQLAQYEYGLRKAGVNVDHVVLCPMSAREMEVYPAEFKIDPQMTQDILEAGDACWGNVLRHEIPQRAPSQNFQHIEDVPNHLRRKMIALAGLKKLSSRIKKDTDTLSTTIKDDMKVAGIDFDRDFGKTRVPMLDISYAERVEIDKDAIIKDFMEMGGNPSDEKYKKVSQQTTISIIRGKKNIYAPLIEEIDEIVNQSVDAGFLDLAEQFGYESLNDSNAIDPTDTVSSKSDGDNFELNEMEF